jgi:L-lactate dehydrogenase complex protein LldG
VTQLKPLCYQSVLAGAPLAPSCWTFAPRRAAGALVLIPDHHICVIFADQLVDTVPQAFVTRNPSRPLKFISGPGATSDIEPLARGGSARSPHLRVLIVST